MFEVDIENLTGASNVTIGIGVGRPGNVQDLEINVWFFNCSSTRLTDVVSANPVYIPGVWFKLAMVTIIVLVAQVIATKRPVVARFVLNGATLFVGCVVVYSGFLLVQNRI